MSKKMEFTIIKDDDHSKVEGDIEQGTLLYLGISHGENILRWGLICKVYDILTAQMLFTTVVSFLTVLYAPINNLLHGNSGFLIFLVFLPFIFDTPAAVNKFFGYWKPYALVLVESELWPSLVLGATVNGVILALVNARMSIKSFNSWSKLVVRLLIVLMLSKISLILPLINIQGIHFQLLQAFPSIINFCDDLKLVTEELFNMSKKMRNVEDILEKTANIHVWMVSSIHKGE